MVTENKCSHLALIVSAPELVASKCFPKLLSLSHWIKALFKMSKCQNVDPLPVSKLYWNPDHLYPFQSLPNSTWNWVNDLTCCLSTCNVYSEDSQWPMHQMTLINNVNKPKQRLLWNNQISHLNVGIKYVSYYSRGGKHHSRAYGSREIFNSSLIITITATTLNCPIMIKWRAYIVTGNAFILLFAMLHTSVSPTGKVSSHRVHNVICLVWARTGIKFICGTEWRAVMWGKQLRIARTLYIGLYEVPTNMTKSSGQFSVQDFPPISESWLVFWNQEHIMTSAATVHHGTFFVR